jgi:hypothetical protein
MGFGSRAFLAGGLGFAAAFAVACGGTNGLLSADQSSTLSSRLDAISSAVGSGNCGAARTASAAFNNAVANLPPSVSTKLVQNLGQGAVTVSQLASQDCSSTTAKTTSTKSTSTSSTSSTTSTTPTVSNSSTTSATQTQTQGTGTATNPTPPGTSTTTNGGASLGTGTAGNGGTGQ